MHCNSDFFRNINFFCLHVQRAVIHKSICWLLLLHREHLSRLAWCGTCWPRCLGSIRLRLAPAIWRTVAATSSACRHGTTERLVQWHRRTMQSQPPTCFCDCGRCVVYSLCSLRSFPDLVQPDTCLLTGAPLKNVGALLRRLDAEPALATRQLGRWVAQGGFAGDNVVPPPWRLAKFDGKTAVGTYNFNGDRAAAELALASRRIASKRLCSKNVCHAVFYDADAHQRLRQVLRQTPGTPENKARIVALSLVYSGMGKYLEKKEGKKFHDPLALAAALDDSIMTWRAVSVRQTQPSYWGSVVVPDEQQSLSAAPVQQISVQVDEEAMWRVLLAVSDTHKQGE